MLTYSRDFLKQLCVSTPVVTEFGNHVKNRFKRLKLKQSGCVRKHRAGWKVALRKKQVNRMHIPSIISSNVRSLPGKFDSLVELMERREHQTNGVIMLQESWLHADLDDGLFQLEGYACFRSDRSSGTRNRGGVVTYVNSEWCCSPRKVFDFSSKTINCLVLECKPRFLSNYHSILLANFYVAPSTPASDLANFVDSFSTAIVVFLDRSLCICAGDLNRFDAFFLTSLGLSNLVNFPTRLDAQLDYVFVNNTKIFATYRRAPLASSDHCILALSPKVYSRSCHGSFIKKASQVCRRRNCSQENLEVMRDMVSSTDFSILFDANPTIFCDQVTCYLNFCFEICCPVETIYIRTDRFSSPLLKNLRRKKERAYKYGNSVEVKSLSAQIKQEVKRLNSIYVQALLGNKNCRELWKALKQLCGNNKETRLLHPDLDSLNREFIGSVTQPTNLSPVFLAPGQSTSCVTREEVLKKLMQVKVGKASGPDLLTPLILKECAAALATPVTTMFNQCLLTGKITDTWRIARITPVPKRGSSKFRPIACTSVLLKLFENVLLDRLKMPVMQEDSHQFAFRRSRSTLDAVAYLVHSVASALDNNAKAVRLLFLDYANAFGSVDRNTLLQLVAAEGCAPDLLRLLQDYFTDRMQFTRLDGQNSSLLPTHAGVLQGAILSPSLFSLYVCNMPFPECSIHCKYADDVVFGSHCIDADSNSVLQNGLNKLVEWSEARSLKLNVTKCQDVIFALTSGQRKNIMLDSIPPLTASGTFLPRAQTVTYLGLTLSSNLSWSIHVQSVFSKVRRLSFFTLRLRMLSVPHNLILRFITACVLPHWLYCSPVVFAGLLKKDYCLFARSLKHVSRCSGISRAVLVDFIVSKHYDACYSFAYKILSDPIHPLYTALSQSLSSSATRANFKCLYARTTTYRNSVIPYLARFLVDSTPLLDDTRSRLLT